MRVSVAIAWPACQEVLDLDVPAGSTLADAVAAAQLATRYPQLDLAQASYGIWSRAASLRTKLREGDRVEVYRKLKADAKDMRRARARLRTSTRSRNEP